MRQAISRLQAYWEATCTASGTFAWQAAQSLGMALMVRAGGAAMAAWARL